jgi:hypothetical protein
VVTLEVMVVSEWVVLVGGEVGSSAQEVEVTQQGTQTPHYQKVEVGAEVGSAGVVGGVGMRRLVEVVGR